MYIQFTNWVGTGQCGNLPTLVVSWRPEFKQGFKQIQLIINSDYLTAQIRVSKIRIQNLQYLLPRRDGNSSEDFIPRGIEESRNCNLSFLGDRGR